MKIICCITCNQIFNLSFDYQECHGKHGGGLYIDQVNARVWGSKDKVFVLGFANSSFSDALFAQLRDGDSDETMSYGGRREVRGRDFTAFVIPNAASSIVRVITKEEFDSLPAV